MFIKNLFITLLIALLSGFGLVMAKANDDFLKSDYDLAVKGEKTLIGAKLEGADLHGLNLSGVDFRGADLEKANLQNADLSCSNLKNTDLEEANLKGANLEGANLSGTELEFATWVDGRTCAEGSIGGCW